MVQIDHEKYQWETIGEEERAQQPFYREGYVRTYEGTAIERRVLSFITDEIDGAAGGVPRNTPEAVARVLIGDGEVSGQGQVETAFDALIENGFIEQREDGTFDRTEAGWVELSN